MTMAQELIRRGKEEGWRDGQKAGWEDGLKAGVCGVAHKMLENGFEIKAIEVATGLSKDKIVALKNGNGQNDQ